MISLRLTTIEDVDILTNIQQKAFQPLYEKYHDEGNPYLRDKRDILCRLDNPKFLYLTIYSSLAFHYIKDFDAFAKEMYSVLNNGGQLLFSQEHPIITATIDGNGHFNKNLKGKRVSYTFSNYNEPGERKVHWYVDGVIKYHRTFSDVINALAKAGFVIEEVCEPTPEEWAIEKLPTIVKKYIKPNFLIVKARKV